MLAALDIRDILIIDRLDLTFQRGLNVLTGETGAGKSILLDALGFVLGWKVRADLVRQGAAQGSVTAVFDLPPDHPVFALLDEAGFPAAEGELILRRTNTPEGRKKAFINDRACTVGVLRRVADLLVELHGQHDDRGLLDPAGHRALLDQYADARAALAGVKTAWAARDIARAALAEAEAALDAARKEEDFLRHAVAELDALAPQPGEDDTLDRQRRMMQGAERIREDIARAADALGPDGAEGRMGDALRWLEDANRDGAQGALEPALAALGRAMVELGEAAGGVDQVLGQLDFNPFELEQIEERLFALRALARKHGVQPDDLAGLADRLRTRLDALDRGAAHLKDLQDAVAAADGAYDSAAARLSAQRAAAAKRLDAAMAAELAPLKMERASFVTAITPAAPGPAGRDAVTFTIATNPGAPAGALNKIASGGELSRFLLALKVCLTADQDGLTLIFDEIDRGVGGATADAVGRRLARLAEDSQVLVVTHSPQVAARGAHHWRVEKRVADDMTTSHVVPLDDGERVDEIARMMSGDTITDQARAAASALIDAA